MASCAKINLPSTGCHRRCNDKISCSVHQQIVFALVCNWLGRENTLGIQLERKLIWHDFTTHNAHLPFLVHWPARHPLCHPPFFFQAAFCCLSFGRCERRKGTSDSRNAFCCLAHFQQATRSRTQDRRPPFFLHQKQAPLSCFLRRRARNRNKAHFQFDPNSLHSVLRKLCFKCCMKGLRRGLRLY